jgi:hypothetical protein
MTHTALRCSDDNTENSRLWNFAATHAAYMYNHMSDKNIG